MSGAGQLAGDIYEICLQLKVTIVCITELIRFKMKIKLTLPGPLSS